MRPTRKSIFSSDLDGTLLGNPEASKRFVRLWQKLPLRKRPLLVYNTGRNVPEVQSLIQAKLLPEPDYIIANVGTELYDFADQSYLKDFDSAFSGQWNLDAITEIVGKREGITPQDSFRSHARKSSWHLHGAGLDTIAEIEGELRQAGEEVALIYSSQRDLDVIPISAGKGNALRWLCDYLDLEIREVLVAGDAGNDVSMFLVPGARGIAPNNAHPQLLGETLESEVYRASAPFAEGVMEGLVHYEVATKEDIERVGRPSVNPRGNGKAPDLAGMEREFIETVRAQAVELLSRQNLWPRLANDSAEFLSIRDSLRVIASVAGFESYRKEARQAFGLVLSYLSPLGLLPSQIALDKKSCKYPDPDDFSAVETNCWAVIAACEISSAAGNRELPKEYHAKLASIMSCVNAYMEDRRTHTEETISTVPVIRRGTIGGGILWYRASCCHARLIWQQGNQRQAALHLARAQYIRGSVAAMISSLARGMGDFAEDGPETEEELCNSISRVSPIGVQGARFTRTLISASMENIMDYDTAISSFRLIRNWSNLLSTEFDWPQQVEDGHPAVALTEPADPVLGGNWVRFLYRLGYEKCARRELYRLSRFNIGGDSPDIESAASFIRACNELKITPPES